MNLEKIEKATYMLLEAIGENPERPGLLDTPKRVANMYKEILNGYKMQEDFHLKTKFEVESSGVLIEKDIMFYSLCEHHLLPFFQRFLSSVLGCKVGELMHREFYLHQFRLPRPRC